MCYKNYVNPRKVYKFRFRFLLYLIEENNQGTLHEYNTVKEKPDDGNFIAQTSRKIRIKTMKRS